MENDGMINAIFITFAINTIKQKIKQYFYYEQ